MPVMIGFFESVLSDRTMEGNVENRLSVITDADSAAIAAADLRTQMRGPVFAIGEDGYDTARRVYNGMIDKRPGVVAHCANIADVIACVNYARNHNLLTAVRGGGHNVAGFGTCDGGIVIDLTGMRGIRIDPQAKTARVEGGCTWGDLDHASHAFGLAAVGGVVSTTGVGGLTLGGGYGYLTRRYGLACDGLVSVDVVTADGSLLTASHDENQDLFWGVRGGGGNFGVVTSLEYQLHPVDTVYGGLIFYSMEHAGDVWRFYRDYIREAPREMGAFIAFHMGPPAEFVPKELQGQVMCAICCCYFGAMEDAEAVVRPIREAAPVLLDLLGPVPYHVQQSIFDPLLPPGLQHYWKADLFAGINDEMIDIHIKHGSEVPTFRSAMHLYPMNGASGDVDPADTAFRHREAEFSMVVVGVCDDPSDNPGIISWVRDYWSALHPHSIGAAAVNFMGVEGQDRVMASYGENYPRLAAVKAKYDQANLFRVNQNIEPGLLGIEGRIMNDEF